MGSCVCGQSDHDTLYKHNKLERPCAMASSSTLEAPGTDCSTSVCEVAVSLSARPSCLLEQLPYEVLTYLLSFLPGPDLAGVARCSTILYHSVQVDSVWQARCHVEHHIAELPEGSEYTFKQFYQLFLYKYGHLLGPWQPDFGAFGGIIHVSLTATGLHGVQLTAPVNPRVRDPLRRVQLFSIESRDARSTSVMCCRGYHSPHQAQAIVEGRDRFTFRCCCVERHRHPEGKQSEFSDWVKGETNGQMQNFLFQGQELLLMKYLIMLQHEASFCLSRLALPAPRPGAVIQPGLFKGTYGGHGIEILALTYDERGEWAYATKVTGDPNVPAGEVSIKADLCRPMLLSALQQAAVSTLLDIDTADLPPGMDINNMPSQPFIVPHDCYDRDANPPDRCKARFHAQGQIAGHGYTTPSYTKSHWVVFDEDTFGHIWLELKSFSIYSRVTEDLT